MIYYQFTPQARVCVILYSYATALVNCIVSLSAVSACFESLVGNQLEVMISRNYRTLYMRHLYPTGLLCQIYCAY